MNELLHFQVIDYYTNEVAEKIKLETAEYVKWALYIIDTHENELINALYPESRSVIEQKLFDILIVQQ